MKFTLLLKVVLNTFLILSFTNSYSKDVSRSNDRITYLSLIGPDIVLTPEQARVFNESLSITTSSEQSDINALNQWLLVEDSSKTADLKRSMFIYNRILEHSRQIWALPKNPSRETIDFLKTLDQFLSTSNFRNSIGVLKRSVWMELISHCRLVEHIAKPNLEILNLCRSRTTSYKLLISSTIPDEVDRTLLYEHLSALEFEQNYREKDKFQFENSEGIARSCSNCISRMYIRNSRPFTSLMRRMNFHDQIILLASKI